jgi:hypothetical protein
MNLPTCPNFLEGSCPRSEVCVSKETDNAFVITCRTCSCVNVFPKDRDERAAKYQVFLKKQADMEQRRQAMERAPAYSISSAGRKS